MPRLSLYKPEKGNDYKFFDRNIKEQFSVGGTDIYLHKYIGPYDQGATNKDGAASPTHSPTIQATHQKPPYKIYCF